MILSIMSNVFCGNTQFSNGYITKLHSNTSNVKLFKIELPNYYHLVPNLLKYLSATELLRAQKYHFEKDTNRFIICRTFLKFILANHTGNHVSEIEIEKDEHKKPFISCKNAICFNVSHAGDYAIIALSKLEVGVDVEYMDESFVFNEILPTVFNSQEIKNVLTSNNKTETFYKFWTRKEAIVKATGKGINDNLPEIQAMDGTHKVPAGLLAGFENIDVVSFYLDENHIAALALKNYNINTENIAMYTLPTTMKELIAFTHNIS